MNEPSNVVQLRQSEDVDDPFADLLRSGELKAEAFLAGMQVVAISVADRVLSISGEKKVEEERKVNGFLLSEPRYGAFQRQIQLPADLDADNIKAQFKDGVLTVIRAKNEKAQAWTRKIMIEKA
jgi:HSP20 family molecular chaperone IbpA